MRTRINELEGAEDELAKTLSTKDGEIQRLTAMISANLASTPEL
jgi:hypothetical protein